MKLAPVVRAFKEREMIRIKSAWVWKMFCRVDGLKGGIFPFGMVRRESGLLRFF
jgi:hypothetical protein